jgi:hypothetical protein
MRCRAGACLGKAEDRIAMIATEVAACSGADLAAGELAADIVPRAIGIPIARENLAQMGHEASRTANVVPDSRGI